MSIRVEFYGIPRNRAGVESAVVDIGQGGAALGQILDELADQYPDLAPDCIDNAALKEGYTANINGERFVTDPSELLPSGVSLLIMSADAGG